MKQAINIRAASSDDAITLTAIAFKSKRHWNYPEEYFQVWGDELTITAPYIKQEIVFVCELDSRIVGFYSIANNAEDRMYGKVFVSKGFWLDHIFISPEYLNKGIGSILINHAKNVCRAMKISRLKIFSDPFAKGFYERIGASYLYESESSIEGRTLPVFELKIQ